MLNGNLCYLKVINQYFFPICSSYYFDYIFRNKFIHYSEDKNSHSQLSRIITQITLTKITIFSQVRVALLVSQSFTLISWNSWMIIQTLSISKVPLSPLMLKYKSLKLYWSKKSKLKVHNTSLFFDSRRGHPSKNF